MLHLATSTNTLRRPSSTFVAGIFVGMGAFPDRLPPPPSNCLQSTFNIAREPCRVEAGGKRRRTSSWMTPRHTAVEGFEPWGPIFGSL
ncbi:hypothetical protein CC79DRAFT_422003 [Sarocladium strictum]